tara:strand:+ start:8227 stop:9195 length:969 start_codon:yes stop_codon:yes gene_type:complete
MKPLFALCLLACFSWNWASAEVVISELEDRFRVEIDGQLFTEWRHQDWKAPYLYPVIGPDGENITRHFPMKDGVEGEQKDHKHHRSIRFSHRNVNGMSFWAPDSNQGGHDVEIRLENVEKMKSGKTGELIFWNDWMGDGKLVMREKVRLVFHPLENRQVLMDFDVEFHAVETPVTFHDEKDGGLGVRVASSMVVEHRATKQGKGTILNSHGDKNAAAWGKRAEWADYFGPGASGKTVGIAMFDHPSNLRFPTHWHARTYGLITANRFGTGYFEAKQGAKRGDGDYTIPVGETLSLRHRLYFHHGDPESAKVAEQYRLYASES